MNFTRRDFIQVTSTSMIGLGVAPIVGISGLMSNTRPVCLFSKCLQFLGYDDLGEVIAKIRFDGKDLTILTSIKQKFKYNML